MLKWELHTVIRSWARKVRSSSVTASKNPCLHSLMCLPAHERVGFKVMMCIWPEGRSRTSLLFSWAAPTQRWELIRARPRWMTEHPYACFPPQSQKLQLSGSKHLLCKCFQEEEPRVKRSTRSRRRRHEKAVKQYHHKFKYFSTQLVSPYKGKATPLWEVQLMSANSTNYKALGKEPDLDSMRKGNWEGKTMRVFKSRQMYPRQKDRKCFTTPDGRGGR